MIFNCTIGQKIYRPISKIHLINVISIYIDAYFYYSYPNNIFLTAGLLISGGIEFNDDGCGNQEVAEEPNGVVRRQDYYLNY